MRILARYGLFETFFSCIFIGREVQESSIIKLAIFRRSKPLFSKRQAILVGEVLLPKAYLLTETFDTVGAYPYLLSFPSTLSHS